MYEKEIMDINLSQIFFQIVNFSVVVGALTILLYKPILKIFEERARRIEEGLKAAVESVKKQEEIDELKKEAKKTIAKEKAAILKEAHTQADEVKAVLLNDAKTEAQELIVKMKADWDNEQQNMLKQSRSQMVEAVIQTAEKVLSEKLSADKKQKELIDTQLDSILKSL